MIPPGVELEQPTDLDPEDETTGALSEDLLFEVLANPRRRIVLRELTVGETYRIGTLAETVGAMEQDRAVDQLSREERKSAYTALQQLHLPKLHRAGLIIYDKNRGTVVPTSAKSEVDAYLACVDGNESRWRYLPALSVAGLGVLFLAWRDVSLFGRLPDIAWAAIVVIGILALVLSGCRSSRSIRPGDR